jgi:hypothetical protein
MPIEAPAGTLEVENAKFRASSVEATIAVGIGTDSNDAYPLQVFKETAPSIRISEGSTISSAARFYSNNSNLYIQTGTDFTSGSSGDIAFQTMGGQSTHMVIKNDGKVGVGTTNPLGKAHIYVDDAASGTQLFIENASTSNRTGLVLRNGDVEDFRIQHTSGSSNAAIIENNSTVNGGIKFYAKGDGDHEFRTTDSNTLRMIIDNGGNVGIGVVNPSKKLHVNGDILGGCPVFFEVGASSSTAFQTYMNFDRQTVNKGGGWTYTNYTRYYAPIAGYYKFDIYVIGTYANGRGTQIQWRKNGTKYPNNNTSLVYDYASSGVSTHLIVSGSTIVYLAVGDWFGIYNVSQALNGEFNKFTGFYLST